ncbi:MarR family winged helix-turn-helix transcriptional regulator [Lutispora thermophila]|uniref:DNA-binding transcriptional regulator, MarR family n=1 Tax=Lutispora thermophila DSM 19022 TaxID=1122184 RepID=A0A1M6CAD8_9FIRM|nr:MarR family transcriptional regulator [Lutispora thermophila]SHI57995.1 DNA-binding transcriptional regulator, MarR family [Lutispora thermophila DSM 19022]
MLELDVAIKLKETHQKITQVMQLKIDEYGLTFGHLRLMMLIDMFPNASQKQLAEKMRFTQGAMSMVVKKLLNLSMLEQVAQESDMRHKRLIITDKGRAMIDEYTDHINKKYKDMFIGFSSEELYEIYDYLTRINDNLGRIISSND